MFDNILNLFKRKNKGEENKINKDKAKERLHLVLMQDRANVSADFLDLMKQEIIEVIKKYIDVDEDKIDVKLTNKLNGDGTTGAPALYANIPIKNIKKETRINSNKDVKILNKQLDNKITKTNPTPDTVKAESSNNVSKTINTKITPKINNSNAKNTTATSNTVGKKENATSNTVAKKENATSNTVAKKENATSNTVAKKETATSNTVAKKETATSNTVAKIVNSSTTTVNSDKTETNINTTSSDDKASKVSDDNIIQSKADYKETEKKEEKNDNNIKNGDNEKVDENNAIKMNKEKTTFFENVIRKKK